MSTITIEIPKKMLKRGITRKLMVVDPKEFERGLRRRWELEDVMAARKAAHAELKTGKARLVHDLKELIK